MLKSKHWFYKMLFSYLPIFFIVTSFLFLSFFLVISGYIKDSTIKANEILSEQVNQAVENILEPIDKIIIREIVVDDTLRQYFNELRNERYTLYQAHQKMNNIKANYSNIDSIYMFRQIDGLIITDNSLISLEDFEDRAFIKELTDEPKFKSWSGKRIYKDHKKSTETAVVSLVRKVPFSTGIQGLIVVNIQVEAIRELVVNMSASKISFVHLLDVSGNSIFSTRETEQAQDREKLPDDSNKELTRIKSPYTEWEIRTGVKEKFFFDFFSTFPIVWFSLGLLSIVIGSVWIVYVTRQNYKPIESLIVVIDQIFKKKNNDLFAKGNQDEIRFISMAIDQLVEQANKFENQFEVDVLRLRRNLFMELLEGTAKMNMAEWKRELARLGLPGEFDLVALSILEIDKYADFCRRYSNRDQYLLKFVTFSVMNEIAQQQQIRLWAEWISDSQLGMIVMADHITGGATELFTSQIDQACSKAITWANENLEFSITFGIGGTTSFIEEIPQLYDDTLDALKYKSILGNKRIIHYSELPSKTKVDIYNHIQLIRSIAQSYRMGEEKWQTDYIQLMHELRNGFTREDVISMLHYLMYYMDREVMELSETIRDKWKQVAMPSLTLLLDSFEMLEEFHEQSLQILLSMLLEIHVLREHGNKYQLIHSMRQYIEDNFADPSLSLIHLSDEFNLSTRHLSRLFKDEFGEKFVDYLVRFRMERAKLLLKDTNEPVQTVTLKVGYMHSFSFIRVFKKTIGITPGDFRK
ncbi:helix-turn-helix domain-containing protein [Paenibacillus agricola]|uniref:Helix-turn-helix transcriptional regulator n=1 Tax=Paenibacillus agricola TaxID=2716264 RepID=A0ABX0JJQ5_9BACL|nr:helix-turn-helix domain-containing protein [Paenibacillus agricola]NHN35038.1 helix-turn-helix transcriptional regulator [Paenibacillus agricola]